MTIPVLRPPKDRAVVDRMLSRIDAVLSSSWWGNGPACLEFERRLAERYGRAHCVTTNSATSALHLALKASGVGPGDDVIVPALTFVSTALAVLYCGARPVFADVDAETLCLDWEHAAELVTSRTRAVMPVDFAGHPSLSGYRSSGCVPLIQDAAHSTGGLSWGDMTCLSFHPVKNLPTGDGGAILLDNDDQAERLRRLRWCGIDRNTWQRADQPRYASDYEIAELGYKYHWNDIQAAIALVMLEDLDVMNARRRQVAARYTAELGDVCQAPTDHPHHTWHLYVIRVAPERRQPLIDTLGAAGIAAGVHYRPLTTMGLFRGQQTPPVTEREWQRCVSLPIHAELTDDEQTQVIDAVREALTSNRRAA